MEAFLVPCTRRFSRVRIEDVDDERQQNLAKSGEEAPASAQPAKTRKRLIARTIRGALSIPSSSFRVQLYLYPASEASRDGWGESICLRCPASFLATLRVALGQQAPPVTY
jgi:hypothetical protein